MRGLIESVSSFHTFTPWRGLAKSLGGTAAVIALVWAYFAAESAWVFIPVGITLALVYASLLILTHDALHTTLSGWKVYDAIFPRVISGPMLWFHAIYTELHFLHHKMNGQDPRDPERVEPTLEEYERAGFWGKTYLRHQWWIRLFVFGGWGMIFSQVTHGLHFWRERPGIRRAFATDLLGIGVSQFLINWWVIREGEWLRWFVLFLILERVIGLVHQFRSHIEHYGLWSEKPTALSPLDVQVFTSRNFSGNGLIRFYLNGLNYHSVHHAFPRIPFYRLAEAERTLMPLYAKAGRPWIIERSYLRTFWALAKAPRFIGK